MRKFIIFYILLFCGVYPVLAEQADEKWKAAIKYYQDAESKVRKGKSSEAVVLLRTCVKKLKQLRYDHPDWNSSVVRNRLNAAEKRVKDVEQLILSSIKNLNRNQLISRLKETEIAKAKFSKAMMIIYEDLESTKQRLLIREADLESARLAAGGKIIDSSRLDKLTFENHKLKKSLKDKDAKISHLEKNLKSIRQGNGTDAVTRNLEEQYTTLLKQEKTLLAEKDVFLKEKRNMLGKLKDLSIKYTDLLQKEKKFNDLLSKSQQMIKEQQKGLDKEKAARRDAQIVAEESAANLKLAMSRVADFEKNEKALLKSIENLKKGTVDKDVILKVKKRNDVLVKENNRLRKVEIDLIAKNKKAVAAAEKNKILLREYMQDTDAELTTNLKKKAESLEKEMVENKRLLELNRASVISLRSENASLKDQLKLQKTVIQQMKKNKPDDKSASKNEEDVYTKNEVDLKDRLEFAQKKIVSLKKENQVLKEKNISGNEEMIRKYIKVRDELQVYRKRLKSVAGTQTSEDSAQILEQVISEEEREAIEQQEKIREYLFQAYKAEKSENLQAAIGLYSKVLQLERKNFDALVRLGFIHYNQRHFHDARAHLNKAWYLEPDNPDVLLALGICDLELDNLNMAVSSLSRLVGMNPKNVTARVQLGISLHGIGWTEAAFSQLKEACQLDKTNAEAAFNYALVCLALPQPKIKEAEKHYELAVSLGMVRDPELDKFFKQQQ